MKKIFAGCFILLMVFVIYLANVDKKVYYLALGNSDDFYIDMNGEKKYGYSYYVKKHLIKKEKLEKFVNDFSHGDARINELILDIKDNVKKNKYTMKNSLIKADLVTISLNISFIYEKLEDVFVDYNEIYEYIDNLASELNDYFALLRKYCKEDIVFVGFYNPYIRLRNKNIDDLISYLNNKFMHISFKYNIDYVYMKSFNDDYNKSLGRKIIKIIDKKILKG